MLICIRERHGQPLGSIYNCSELIFAIKEASYDTKQSSQQWPMPSYRLYSIEYRLYTSAFLCSFSFPLLLFQLPSFLNQYFHTFMSARVVHVLCHTYNSDRMITDDVDKGHIVSTYPVYNKYVRVHV